MLIVNFIDCFYVNDEPESKFLYTETIKLYLSPTPMSLSVCLDLFKCSLMYSGGNLWNNLQLRITVLTDHKHYKMH